MVEALVALFILTALSVVLYRGLSSGMRVTHFAQGAEDALLVAKSRLAALGIETPLHAGEGEGREGGVTWHSVVRPYGSAPVDAASTAPRGYWATVTVSWQERNTRAPRSLTLTTLKLGGAK